MFYRFASGKILHIDLKLEKLQWRHNLMTLSNSYDVALFLLLVLITDPIFM